jgi:ATP-dependent Zn protease
VRELLHQAYETAKKIITQNKELHIKISDVLMNKQEMLREEFDLFFEGIKVPEKIAY